MADLRALRQQAEAMVRNSSSIDRAQDKASTVRSLYHELHQARMLREAIARPTVSMLEVVVNQREEHIAALKAELSNERAVNASLRQLHCAGASARAQAAAEAEVASQRAAAATRAEGVATEAALQSTSRRSAASITTI